MPPEVRLVQLLGSVEAGDSSCLRAAAELLHLRDELGVYANDPHFLPFTAINAAVAELEGFAAADCSSGELEHEFAALEAWAQEFSEDARLALTRRYSAKS